MVHDLAVYEVHPPLYDVKSSLLRKINALELNSTTGYAGTNMSDLGELIGHWGYLAIFLVVIFGNLGIPVPEEAILLLAGYLVWEGKLWLPAVLVVGIASAAAGDNIGYWLGRRYGRAAVQRYGRWLFLTPERFDSARRFVSRYGPLGVFIARFFPGLRFMAGPLAGISGLPFVRFLVANVSGAALYVPLTVAVGYAIGYGLGGYVEKVQRLLGRIEHIVLIAIIICAVVIFVLRAIRVRKSH